MAMIVALAYSQPDCTHPWSVTDPATGQTFNYDLTSVLGKQFVAMEQQQTFHMYINLCGNVNTGQPVTCPTATPICMVDGSVAYNCGGSGPGNWMLKPYRGIGSNEDIYGGGIRIQALDGDACMYVFQDSKY
jgi:hypothetical protein